MNPKVIDAEHIVPTKYSHIHDSKLLFRSYKENFDFGLTVDQYYFNQSPRDKKTNYNTQYTITNLQPLSTIVELDIPFFCCVGVPGPRIPMAPQKVELIDEVCWYFPELKFVMRHGAEPWTALACKLMLKYPNLYYSTSAFSPKHYPKDIINFANTRGKNKIMYAGYFPMGLSLDKIFSEMNDVPFNDDVWPLFLGENAKKILKL